MEWLKVHDPDAHAHVWLGECRSASDAQIFRGKYVVESFTVPPGADGPYFGLDLGFAADPSVLTKCWVHDSKLYVEAEAWQLHCDIDKLPDLLRQIPDSHKYTIRCDSARPEAVSYLRAHGFPGVVSVDKWPDSIADGIARMRAFEKILLHSSCEHTALEFRLYAHKTDRLTGDVLPDIIDRHNDCCDSLRYALAPLIKGSGPGALLAWMAQDAAAQKTQATALRDRPGVIVRDLTSGG
jgi:phage terminase large subunit